MVLHPSLHQGLVAADEYDCLVIAIPSNKLSFLYLHGYMEFAFVVSICVEGPKEVQAGNLHAGESRCYQMWGWRAESRDDLEMLNRILRFVHQIKNHKH